MHEVGKWVVANAAAAEGERYTPYKTRIVSGYVDIGSFTFHVQAVFGYAVAVASEESVGGGSTIARNDVERLVNLQPFLDSI
jgi:hypothetical protein